MAIVYRLLRSANPTSSCCELNQSWRPPVALLGDSTVGPSRVSRQSICFRCRLIQYRHLQKWIRPARGES